jgi:pyruvate-ferredoxin/flavodoxin oxidoreductase
MARFAELTGRRYRLFDYAGHPEAERVIVMMGSGAECAHETVDHLVARGERVGVVKVRLFRPFSLEHFLAALPSSVRSIAVLDRTKEPGSAGEPLLLEITSALVETVARGVRPNVPRVLGGRYGLSSKELTPAMVKGVFDELGRDAPRSRFTVGIRDDVSGSSLAWDPEFDIEPDDVSRAVFFGLGSDGTVSANKATIKIIGEHTPGFAQGHFEYDSRKAGSTTISHLRFGPRPIRSTYRIQRAQLVAVHDPEFLERRDVLATAMPGAIVLVNTSAPPEHVWGTLPLEVQEQLLARRCRLYVIDGHGVAERAGLGRRINTVMQVCFFALAKVIPLDDALREIRRSLEATFGRRGPEVVRRNVVALETALAALHEVPLPAAVSTARRRPPAVSPQAPDFVQRVTRLLLEGRGDELPVSAFPPDGTWPSGTSRFGAARCAADRQAHRRASPAAVRVFRRLRRLRRDAVPPPAHPALRRPAGDRQCDRMLVDLRRQPADDPVHGRSPWPGARVGELAVRGQRRDHAALRSRSRQEAAQAHQSRSEPGRGPEVAGAQLGTSARRDRRRAAHAARRGRGAQAAVDQRGPLVHPRAG